MRKDFSLALGAAYRRAVEYLNNVDDRPVGPTATLDELRARICKQWNKQGISAEQVVDELARDIDGGLNNSVSARFYAWVIGGSLPAALAADWLTSTWDQNAGMYAVSPASAIVEEAVGAWLIDVFRLPKETAFALVTGCQMAHTTCLAAARDYVLRRHGWDVERQGMAGSPPIKLFCGVRHTTIDRAVRLLGLGDASLLTLDTNEKDQLRPMALENALRNHGGKPAIVLLQAGDVNTGGLTSSKRSSRSRASTARGRTWMARSACGRQRVRGMTNSRAAWRRRTRGRVTATSG